ncbi:LysR family transcriptional regulator [Nocardia sp. A7]|uniref:LysR family transcriptional regulator n=1 Tax=Nocardia sp. A7 TaxID=2789274 RepID=UPI00397CF13C
MLRAAAALADCLVGIDDRTRNLCIGLDAQGRALPEDERDRISTTRQVKRAEHLTVWLDRHGPPKPLDQLILERLARSVHGVRPARSSDPDGASIEVICNSGATDAARTEALSQLGLRPESPVTVTVSNIADSHGLPAGSTIDDVQVHLWPSTTVDEAVPAAIAVGMLTCAGRDIHRMWHLARTALRIAVDPATSGPCHVDYSTLGSIAAVVDAIDARSASKVEDVRVLLELNNQRPWVVSSLDAVLSCDSTREVARQLNLHHSTVQQRVSWIGTQLGYPLFSRAGRARAATTLLLWRIVAADERIGQSTSPSQYSGRR